MSSSVKQYNLFPFIILPTTAISTNTPVISSVSNIFFKDNVGLQFVWTGTLAGAFDVQISADYDIKRPALATWTSMSFSTAPIASGAPGNLYIDITQISAPFMRVVFTQSAGSGNLTGTIVAKAV